MSTLNRDQIATQARSLLDSRVTSVTRLVDAQVAVNTAEETHRDAWKSALKNGWSEAELRKLGFTKPVFPRASRRDAKAKTKAQTTPQEDAAGGDHDGQG